MGFLDFLLGSEEPDRRDNLFDWDRSVADDRRHRSRGSGNWTSREDWDCGNSHEDGMSGFDNYEDNDF